MGAGATAAALLAAPGPEASSLDGLPLSSATERLILLLLLVSTVTPQARSQITAVLRRPRVVAAGIALLAFKIAAFAVLDPAGWAACYRSPIGSPSPCEMSYENPWRSSDATRYDRVIDFRPGMQDSSKLAQPADYFGALSGPLPSSNWPLQFVNHLRFNLYDEVPGDAHTERLPVFADWQGTVNGHHGLRGAVTYVGQGTITIGGRPTTLPPSYGAVARVTVTIPPGRQNVRLSYRFDNGLTVGVATPEGPWAQVKFGYTDGRPVETASLDVPAQIGVWALEGLAIGLVFALMWSALLALRRHLVWMGLAMGMAGVALLGGPLSGADSVLFFIALGVVLIQSWRRRASASLAGAALLVLLVINSQRVLAAVGGFDAVIYRRPGSDWLTYESFARDVFETGSLQGGEDVFFYQPGFRYVSVFLHSTLGDSDAAIGIVASSLLSLAVLLLVARARPGSWTRPGVALVLSSAAAGLLLLNLPETTTLVRIGVSEYPTWAVPPLLALCWFVPWPPRRRLVIAGALLVAFAFVVRTNQAPGLALPCLALLLAPRPRHLWQAVAAGALVVALLPLHNVVYGQDLRVLPTSGSLPGQTPVPIADLPRALTEDTIGRAVQEQLRIMAFLPASTYTPPPGDRLQYVAHLIQALWLLALLRAIALRRLLRPREVLILLWPLAYLVPYLSFDARNSFPRHILVAYVAAVVAIIVVEMAGARRRGDGSSRRLAVALSSPRDLYEDVRRAWRAGGAAERSPPLVK